MHMYIHNRYVCIHVCIYIYMYVFHVVKVTCFCKSKRNGTCVSMDKLLRGRACRWGRRDAERHRADYREASHRCPQDHVDVNSVV